MKKLLIIIIFSLDIVCVEINCNLNIFQKNLLLKIIEKTHNENLYTIIKANNSDLLTNKKFITFFHEISHSIVKFIGIENKLLSLISKEQEDAIQILNDCIGKSCQKYFFLEDQNESYKYFYNCLFYAIGIASESLLYTNKEKEKPIQEYINLETFYELAKTGDINLFYENYTLLISRLSSDYNKLNEEEKKIFLEENITIFIESIEEILNFLQKNIQIIIQQFNTQASMNRFIIKKHLFIDLPTINDPTIESKINYLRDDCFSISNKYSVPKSSIGKSDNFLQISPNDTPLKESTNTQNSNKNSVEKTNTSNENFLKKLLGDDFSQINWNKNNKNSNNTTGKKRKKRKNTTNNDNEDQLRKKIKFI
jgi:hypothetical protein